MTEKPQQATLTVKLQSAAIVLSTTHAFLGNRVPPAGALTPITGVAGVYGDASHVPKITVNQYGQITNVELIEVVGGAAPAQAAYLLLDDGDYLVTESGIPLILE